MTTIGNRNNSYGNAQQPVTNWLHPWVYGLMIALTAWFALAVWSFAGSGLVNYLLFVVSGFMFVTVALTLILSRVGHQDAAAQPGKEPSLRDWARWDYDTWTGRLSGAQAAAQILLPLAAAAVGMTVIGLIFRFAAHAAT
jgi:hypothetical protein